MFTKAEGVKKVSQCRVVMAAATARCWEVVRVQLWWTS